MVITKLSVESWIQDMREDLANQKPSPQRLAFESRLNAIAEYVRESDLIGITKEPGEKKWSRVK